jgi:hypothetical protein
MLRYQHRLSRDIDIFMDDVKLLGRLSPRLNETPDDPPQYSESANVLRLIYPEGEIDFMAVASVIPGLSRETLAVDGVAGRPAFQATPDIEILAQKLFYRAWAFTGRDLYDFATIARRRPGVLADERLHRACASRLDTLKAAVEAPACREGYASIVAPTLDLGFDDAKALLRRWIEGGALDD